MKILNPHCEREQITMIVVTRDHAAQEERTDGKTHLRRSGPQRDETRCCSLEALKVNNRIHTFKGSTRFDKSRD
ncbi:hypothetical protein YK56LOC_67740 [Caballeronia sp. HLA56]